MIYIGIDPRLQGAFAVVLQDGALLYACRTPIIAPTGKGKTDYDLPAMAALLRDWSEGVNPATVAVEKVASMPHDGVAASFRFGMGYGIWLGLMAALSVPYIEVTPQRWQAKMLAGLPRGPKSKASAMRAAKSLFPTIPVRVKADNGIADAALLAEYGRRIHQGGK